MLKKLFMPFFLLSLVITFSACSGESGPILDTRDRNIDLICTLTVGDTVNTLHVTLAPMADGEVRKGEIELLSPDELKGVKVLFGHDGTFLSYGDIRIPIPTDSFSSGLLSSLFSLSDTNITAVRATADGNTEAEAQNERGRYIITLDKKTEKVSEASGVFDGREFSLTAEEYIAS